MNIVTNNFEKLQSTISRFAESRKNHDFHNLPPISSHSSSFFLETSHRIQQSWRIRGGYQLQRNDFTYQTIISHPHNHTRGSSNYYIFICLINIVSEIKIV
ncbi:unnamed protein product [Caenorhabditis angaria]|uniref:Uncharacterized protein n=1 Tax=Caenorhabditis angaria TaxID=860376 RepID=A0A9P1I7H3_9PELO|nr:unnamed protein product [Caenorhabditis angaria]